MIVDAVTESLKQVSKLHELVDSVTTDYERFFFNEAGRAIYDFFWSDFADWYESN
jgi:valyl-tRNA synthetase